METSTGGTVRRDQGPTQGSVRHDEGRLVRKKSAGEALHFDVWLPAEDEARAVVALVHGFGEYAARYDHVARSWADRGIGVVAVDLHGHGHSAGTRGSCRHFNEYLSDVAELVELMRERANPLPAFLFGHSFGGLVATAEGLASPSRWRAVILSSPALGLAVKVPVLKKVAGEIASRVLPDFALPANVKGADLTHDEAVARAYDEDPLVLKVARARWYTETLAAEKKVMASARTFSLPLYIAVGTQDHVTDVGTARAFFQAVESADKTWDAGEGLFHEVLNEPDWPQLATRMADWILKRA